MKKSTFDNQKKEISRKNEADYSKALRWEVTLYLKEILNTWIDLKNELNSNSFLAMYSFRFRLIFEDELVNKAIDFIENIDNFEKSEEFWKIISKMQKEAEKISKKQIPSVTDIMKLNILLDQINFDDLFDQPNKKGLDYSWFDTGAVVTSCFCSFKDDIVNSMAKTCKTSYLDVSPHIKFISEHIEMFVDFCNIPLIEALIDAVNRKNSNDTLKILDACIDKAGRNTALQGLVIMILENEVEYER